MKQTGVCPKCGSGDIIRCGATDTDQCMLSFATRTGWHNNSLSEDSEVD